MNMFRLFIFILAFSQLPIASADPGPLRFWYSDSGRGAYFQSYYNEDLGYVQFHWCGAMTVNGKRLEGSCERVDRHAIKLDQLDHYQAPMIQALKQVRVNYAEALKTSKWQKVRRWIDERPENRNLSSLDALISKLELYGLKNWVLQYSLDDHEFTSSEVADQVTAAIRDVLEPETNTDSGAGNFVY